MYNGNTVLTKISIEINMRLVRNVRVHDTGNSFNPISVEKKNQLKRTFHSADKHVAAGV